MFLATMALGCYCIEPEWGALDLLDQLPEECLALLPDQIGPAEPSSPAACSVKRRRRDTTTSDVWEQRADLFDSEKASAYAILAADPTLSLTAFGARMHHTMPHISADGVEAFYSDAFQHTHLVLSVHMALLAHADSVIGYRQDIVSNLKSHCQGRSGFPLSTRQVEEWFVFCLEPLLARSPSDPLPCSVEEGAFAVPVVVLSDSQMMRLFAAASARYDPTLEPVRTTPNSRMESLGSAEQPGAVTVVNTSRTSDDSIVSAHDLRERGLRLLMSNPLISQTQFRDELGGPVHVAAYVANRLYGRLKSYTSLPVELHELLLTTKGISLVPGSRSGKIVASAKQLLRSRGREVPHTIRDQLILWHKFCVVPLKHRHNPSNPPCAVDNSGAEPVIRLSPTQSGKLFQELLLHGRPPSGGSHSGSVTPGLDDGLTSIATTPMPPSDSEPGTDSLTTTSTSAAPVQMSPPSSQERDFAIVEISLLADNPEMPVDELVARTREVIRSAEPSEIISYHQMLLRGVSVTGQVHNAMVAHWNGWPMHARIRASSMPYDSRGRTGPQRIVNDWMYYCVIPLGTSPDIDSNPPCYPVVLADGSVVYSLSIEQRKRMFADRLAIELNLNIHREVRTV